MVVDWETEAVDSLDVSKVVSSEVTSVLVWELLEKWKVSDSAVRVDPSVGSSVVRRIVAASGREPRVVRGHVVAVTSVRAVVVLVSSGILVVSAGVVTTVVGSTAVVVIVVVVGRRVVGRRVVVGAFISVSRTLFFTSLNQPGTSMRQQYTLSSPVMVLKMVKDTSPLPIFP